MLIHLCARRAHHPAHRRTPLRLPFPHFSASKSALRYGIIRRRICCYYTRAAVGRAQFRGPAVVRAYAKRWFNYRNNGQLWLARIIEACKLDSIMDIAAVATTGNAANTGIAFSPFFACFRVFVVFAVIAGGKYPCLCVHLWLLFPLPW